MSVETSLYSSSNDSSFLYPLSVPLSVERGALKMSDEVDFRNALEKKDWTKATSMIERNKGLRFTTVSVLRPLVRAHNESS